ncbi:MAG TPA: hypothetical protein HA354_05115 [Candidatus Poseidoniaceae archaeon]|nr:hypothetical protein [Candidatus Poseidoniaceae archaeon]
MDRAKRMRHLIVPSVDTQHWFEIIKSNGWAQEGLGILTTDDGLKAIPLNSSAPAEDNSVWQDTAYRIILRSEEITKHWAELIDQELLLEIKEFLPRSHEIIGDILVVKLEDEIYVHREIIADAMLEQLPNVRLICADKGVQGKFRVRDLLPIKSRQGDLTTLTKVKEHGQIILVDPTKSYFSTRLSTERQGSYTAAEQLFNVLGRAITVCDPYAGVGPALAGILAKTGLVDRALIGDLNPSAVELLQQNIAKFLSKNTRPAEVEILCQDGRKWRERAELNHKVDLLLVNLPHQMLSHLGDLLPLMRRHSPSLIRGWAIVEKTEIQNINDKLTKLFADNGAINHNITCSEVKGFSSSKSFVRVESWQEFQ